MKDIAGLVTDGKRDLEQHPTPEKLDFKVLVRTFRYARAYKRMAIILTGLTIIRSIQLPFLAWALGAVINGPIAGGDRRGLFWGVVGFTVLALITQLTMRYRQNLALRFGEAVLHDLRRDIFVHLQSLTMGFYNRTRIGYIISRFTSDLESLRAGIQNVLFVSIVQGGQMLFSGLIMLYYDWLLFLVMLGISPVIWAINRHFRKQLSFLQRQLQESFSRVTATLAESVNGIRITQSYVRQEVNAGFFRKLMVDHSRYNIEAARANGIFIPLLELNSQLFVAVLLLVGGYRVAGGSPPMEIGDLIQFFFLANLFFEPVKSLGNQFVAAITAAAGAERVFRLLDMKPDWTDAPDAKDLIPIQGKVSFENVHFEYVPGRPVLKGVSFNVDPGQSIALVGHTGSGKSSIINLVTKFYLPSAGTIKIDGQDILSITSSSLHEQMGIVQQQNFLFSGSVMDNIRSGNIQATDDEVIECIKKLDCYDMFTSLPEGLNTDVGERGGGLSLGQRQMICFARAMLANPRILILDEATSSIDTLTEARTQKALEILLQGRTSFIVAHRLSTIIHAHQVLVLDHGEIIEHGNHKELLRQGGVYAQLYRQFIQASES